MLEKNAIGMLEFNSIARGIKTLDLILKKAPIKILYSVPVCPGKYVILFNGDEASVFESLKEGTSVGSGFIVDTLYLPNPDEQVPKAIVGVSDVQVIDSLAVIETFSVASTIISADIACKAAEIKIVEMRLANGIGGKSYFTFTGNLNSVEASFNDACEYAKGKGLLVDGEIIPAPHKDLKELTF